MAKKLGDVTIALVIIGFVITGLSSFIANADATTGIDSGIVSSSLNDYEGDLGNIKDVESSLTAKTDSSGSFTVEDGNTQVEERGVESSGVMNLGTKNVIMRFLDSVSENIPGMGQIKIFLASLIGVVITILTLRFIWGEGKI